MTKIRMMRIHRFGGPDVLQADDVELSLPDASQVLVSVKAASVNPVDFKIRSGKYAAAIPLAGQTAWQGCFGMVNCEPVNPFSSTAGPGASGILLSSSPKPKAHTWSLRSQARIWRSRNLSAPIW
jgi:hypothetical protein